MSTSALEALLAPVAADLQAHLARHSPTLALVPPGITPALLAPEAVKPDVETCRRLVADAYMGRPFPALDLTFSGPAVQTALLKFIEDGAAGLGVLLIARTDTTILSTLTSRCFAWRFPDLEALPGTFETVLRSRGVSGAKIENLPRPYPGTIEDALLEARIDRGPLDELLRALALRDPVRAVVAARAFTAEHVAMLGQTIRWHLSGRMPLVAFERQPVSFLAAWADALAAHGLLAVRWGVAECVSRA